MNDLLERPDREVRYRQHDRWYQRCRVLRPAKAATPTLKAMQEVIGASALSVLRHLLSKYTSLVAFCQLSCCWPCAIPSRTIWVWCGLRFHKELHLLPLNRYEHSLIPNHFADFYHHFASTEYCESNYIHDFVGHGGGRNGPIGPRTCGTD